MLTFASEMKSTTPSYKRLLCLLPLLAFLWYYGNITCCTHTHIVDGKVVAHSHAGCHQHQHQGVEFQQIHDLSHVSFLQTNFFTLSVSPLNVCSLQSKVEHIAPLVASVCHFLLRAPPVMG